ncbi:MAG: GNAT family N-acetyltransferase [Alphaproteobacteria bacterium]|nr:GNAT family N-acetyltransferase [Alphaproteobacteria bacterium]
MSALRVEALTGDALRRHLPDVARLRIEVFRDFPYLYDGDLESEARYIGSFAASQNAVVVGAFDNDTVVGASTAAPLASQMDDVTAPFRAQGADMSRIFYFGESVLKSTYRGQGIGVRFFEEREAHALRCGASVAAFCAVVRDAGHAARPRDHVPLDAFWCKRGYAPVEGLLCSMAWKEVGGTVETRKEMQFWTKRLAP